MLPLPFRLRLPAAFRPLAQEQHPTAFEPARDVVELGQDPGRARVHVFVPEVDLHPGWKRPRVSGALVHEDMGASSAKFCGACPREADLGLIVLGLRRGGEYDGHGRPGVEWDPECGNGVGRAGRDGEIEHAGCGSTVAVVFEFRPTGAQERKSWYGK